jgi:hypothetical protein
LRGHQRLAEVELGDEQFHLSEVSTISKVRDVRLA